jgi:hypothetical protein
MSRGAKAQVPTPTDLPHFRGAPTRVGETWSGDAPIVVCFGDRCVRGRLRNAVRGLNTEPVFTLAFSLTDIAEAMPDLVTVVRVYTDGEPSQESSSSRGRR